VRAEGGFQMRRIVITVLLALLLVSDQQASAENVRVITLSCDGTITDKTNRPAPLVDHQPKPVEKMGVVVNLDEQTVSFQGYIARIIIADAANVNFGGEQVDGPLAQLDRSTGHRQNITGVLDRVTGHMLATTTLNPTKQPYDPNAVVVSDEYDVVCKATNRVF
jgi:hypothetical protein